MAGSTIANRDKQGRSLRAVLTGEEFRRLDALFQAKALVDEMAQGQRLLATFVEKARANGATWMEIGEATGMSAQGANQRWSPTSSRFQAPPAKKPARVPVKREVQSRLAV
jgi:hypothetical protein